MASDVCCCRGKNINKNTKNDFVHRARPGHTTRNIGSLYHGQSERRRWRRSSLENVEWTQIECKLDPLPLQEQEVTSKASWRKKKTTKKILKKRKKKKPTQIQFILRVFTLIFLSENKLSHVETSGLWEATAVELYQANTSLFPWKKPEWFPFTKWRPPKLVF